MFHNSHSSINVELSSGIYYTEIDGSSIVAQGQSLDAATLVKPMGEGGFEMATSAETARL